MGWMLIDKSFLMIQKLGCKVSSHLGFGSHCLLTSSDDELLSEIFHKGTVSSDSSSHEGPFSNTITVVLESD